LNKSVYILLFSELFFSACKSGKNLPAGAPEAIKPKHLQEQIANAENRFNTLHIVGTGNYSNAKDAQSFRLEIRILQDSLIWIDIADPLIGIKVARAIVYKDSVAFMNRLDKEYFSGNIGALQERFKLDFGFETLQSILSANTLFALSDKEFELFYKPGAYLLSDFNPDPKGEEGGMEKYFGKEKFRQTYIDPANFKPTMQVQKEPTFGKSYTVENQDIKTVGSLKYPETIALSYTQNETTNVRIDVKKVDVDEPGLNFPFNIPSSYAEMR